MKILKSSIYKFHNLWTRYKDRKSKGIFGVTRLHEGIGFNRGQ